jgi:hypothetical protein
LRPTTWGRLKRPVKPFKRSLGAWWFALLCAFPALAADNETAWAALKKPGAIVIFRHALATGGGDPVGHALNDCSAQTTAGVARPGYLGGGDAPSQHCRVDRDFASLW